MMPDGAVTRRTKPSEERRNDLLDAAQALFIEQGASATTVEQIASRAQVAKGTFYLYFPSKDEVATALRQRFARELLASVETAMNTASGWEEQLDAWAVSCVAFYARTRQLHDALFRAARPATSVGLIDNILIDHLRDLLRRGHEAGGWSLADPRSTAIFLFGGLHALVESAFNETEAVDEPELAATASKLLRDAVGSKNPRRPPHGKA
jgi:AcrR family transcriptional regulator